MSVFQKLKSSAYIKQIYTLASGTTVAHAITILSYFVITKIFTPTQVGDLSFFQSSIAILSIIGTATFEYAIVLPKKNNKAFTVLAVSVGLCFLISTGSFIGIFFLESYLSSWLDFSLLFLLTIPLGALMLGVFHSLTYWFVRGDMYKELSYGKIIQSGSTAGSQILLGFLQYLNYGLIFGYLIGRAFANLYLVFKSKINRLTNTKLTWERILDSIKEYAEQPKFILFSTLLSKGAIEVPVFLISILFNNELLGFYALAYRLLGVPTQLIGTSVGHVFYRQSSERYTKKQPINKFLLKTWGGLFLVGILPILVVFFYGEPIFGFIFGEEWVTAGSVAIILAPVFLFRLITSPTEKIMLVLGLQKLVPLFSLVDFAGRIIGLYIGYTQNDFFLGILMLTVFQLLAIALLNAFILYKTRKYDKAIKTT